MKWHHEILLAGLALMATALTIAKSKRGLQFATRVDWEHHLPQKPPKRDVLNQRQQDRIEAAHQAQVTMPYH